MIQCQFEDGGKASLRHVTVVAIIANKNGEVLITKRAPHLLRGGRYTIPGGFLDRDENVAEGVAREVKEETGLFLSDLTLFRINDNPERPKEDRQNVDFVFIAKSDKTETIENEEVSEFKWVSIESLPQDNDFAFDHRDSIIKYFQYLKQSFKLPIIG